MNALKKILIIICLSFSTSYYVNNVNDNSFMTMSSTCWISPDKEYGCDYIPIILSYDPDSYQDIKKVCDTSQKGNYTVTDFANLVNTRLDNLGFESCQLTVIRGYGNYQLRSQCPKVFDKYCKNWFQTLDNDFMQMNNKCEVASSTLYSCDDIPFILSMDPDHDTDLKNICEKSKTSNFNNDQLASLVNLKLQKYGLSSCRVSVLNNLGNVQLKDQCPKDYKQFCNNYM